MIFYRRARFVTSLLFCFFCVCVETFLQHLELICQLIHFSRSGRRARVLFVGAGFWPLTVPGPCKGLGGSGRCKKVGFKRVF